MPQVDFLDILKVAKFNELIESVGRASTLYTDKFSSVLQSMTMYLTWAEGDSSDLEDALRARDTNGIWRAYDGGVRSARSLQGFCQEAVVVSLQILGELQLSQNPVVANFNSRLLVESVSPFQCSSHIPRPHL